MTDSEQQMRGKIAELFREDRRLLEGRIPTNGIWAHSELLDTGYQCAIRILPNDLGSEDYALWVDVFETIYDPVYSNTLFKGSLEEIRSWLQDESHIGQVYQCMHHLYDLAEEGL